MRCKQAQRALSLWMDGRLEAKQAQALQEHLNACPACQGVWQEWEETRTALRGYPLLSPSPAFEEHLLAALPLASHSSLRGWFSLPWVRLSTSALAGLVVAGLIGLGAWWMDDRTVSSAQPIHSESTFESQSLLAWWMRPPARLHEENKGEIRWQEKSRTRSWQPCSRLWCS